MTDENWGEYEILDVDDDSKEYYEIKDDGMPSTEHCDEEGFCWWGWGASAHGNPRFWKAGWAYGKEPKGATHWAPCWAFPVIK